MKDIIFTSTNGLSFLDAVSFKINYQNAAGLKAGILYNNKREQVGVFSTTYNEEELADIIGGFPYEI